jgi:hypothetical protein
MRLLLSGALFVAACAGVIACGGGSNSPAPPSGTPRPTPTSATPQPTPTSATPQPSPSSSTLLYLGTTAGITVLKADGTLKSFLPIPVDSFDLDDAGNIYALYYNQNNTLVLAKYPAGTATAGATYTPSGPGAVQIAVSGAGEVVVVRSGGGIPSPFTMDIWDPGTSGAPSRSFTTAPDPAFNWALYVAHDGTIYLSDHSVAGVPQFDVFSPGSAVPSRTIPETIVAPSQYAAFAPNFATTGSDETLYVTEYSFSLPDPNAGLYIYPVSGPERFVATATNANGSGAQGVDLDSSGNIYVVNNNAGFFFSNLTCQGDSLQSVTVYSQTGTLLRTIDGTGIFTGYQFLLAPDDSGYLTSIQTTFLEGCATTGIQGVLGIPAGGSTASKISTLSPTLVLYDGEMAKGPFAHSRHGASGAFAIRRYGLVRSTISR